MHVLVVCSGNICRSPFAEAALRRHIEGSDIVVSSAGTVAESGAPATTLMRAVAHDHGLDLDGHRARRLTDVDRPDLVLGMETFHLASARRVFETLPPDRLRLLDHPQDVPDPYGHGRDAYERSADQMLRAIDRLEIPPLDVG